ncbi:hypothetical protein L9F63_022436 [Diploptera punctata]|uniref:Uncharacterized protein n=1 Tax=Diploptera punctata TaxID=6984 RepID=A0AAD8EAE1_DIPPU|nr:hypothetical protein L9F63_022436 [Diploptera punctata]
MFVFILLSFEFCLSVDPQELENNLGRRLGRVMKRHNKLEKRYKRDEEDESDDGDNVNGYLTTCCGNLTKEHEDFNRKTIDDCFEQYGKFYKYFALYAYSHTKYLVNLSITKYLIFSPTLSPLPSSASWIKPYDCATQCASTKKGLIDDEGYIKTEEMLEFMKNKYDNEELNESVRKLIPKCVEEGNQCSREIVKRKKTPKPCNPAEELVNYCIDEHIYLNCPKRFRLKEHTCSPVFKKNKFDLKQECKKYYEN